MSMHNIEFEYDLPEYGALQMDLDPALDQAEKEEIALAEIKEVYPDVTNLEITKVTEIN